MSKILNFVRIKIENSNFNYKNEKLEYRKSQLTIAKKKPDFNINYFILDKLISKLDGKYKFFLKKDEYVFFIENKDISKFIYETIEKNFNDNILKNINYSKSSNLKKINLVIIQINEEENTLSDSIISNFSKLLIIENNDVNKLISSLNNDEEDKDKDKDKYEDEDENEDEDEEEDEDEQESDYNSDYNEFEDDEDELKDLDYENDVILDELEELEDDNNSDLEEEIPLNMNNTVIFIKDNIIKQEFTIENDYTQLYNTRKKTIDIFKNILNDMDIIRKIELSILNYSIDKCKGQNIIPTWENPNFTYIYINKCRHIYLNLDQKSYIKNDYLIKEIKKKEFDLLKIAYLKREEIMPSVWMPLVEENKRKEEIMNKSQTAEATNQYVCPNRNCRARKSLCKEVQTRSADEPMTLFLTCLVCGKKWKF